MSVITYLFTVYITVPSGSDYIVSNTRMIMKWKTCGKNSSRTTLRLLLIALVGGSEEINENYYSRLRCPCQGLK
jgi:hypothetical protein